MCEIQPVVVANSSLLEEVIYVDDGPVSTIILNRPEAANALSLKLLTELHVGLDEVRKNTDCSVLVITGAGGNFCGGDDPEEVSDGAAEHATASVERFKRSRDEVLNKLEQLDKFTVCAVDGDCVGTGLEIAMACDFVVSTERSVSAARSMNEDSSGPAGKSPPAGPPVGRVATGTYLRAALGPEVGPFRRVVDNPRLGVETVHLVERLVAAGRGGN